MTRADQAKPGDRTRYGTTVDRKASAGGGHILLYTHNDAGQQFEEVWTPGDDIEEDPIYGREK